MSKLKSIFDEILAQYLVELAVTVCAVVFKSFVDNVPAFYTTLITTCNCNDVLTHPFFQNFRSDVFPIVINKEPLAYLRMPDKTMPCYNLVVFFSKRYNFVCICPLVFVFFGMDKLGLHTVFGNNVIEFISNQF